MILHLARLPPLSTLAKNYWQLEGLRLLRGYLEQYPSLDLLDAVFQWLLAASGPEEAYRLVREELRRNPLHHGGDGHIGLPLSIEGGHGAQFYREPSHRPRIARHLALPVRAGGKLCAKIALS